MQRNNNDKVIVPEHLDDESMKLAGINPIPNNKKEI